MYKVMVDGSPLTPEQVAENSCGERGVGESSGSTGHE